MVGECWEAEATIRIRNPIVLLGDTDEAGTGADFDVIRVSEYKRCEKRESPAESVARLIAGQPKDVITLITRINECNYWQGEWPYAEVAEKNEIVTELARLNCPELPKVESQIRAKYVGNAKIIRSIDAVKALEN